ncbi:MAG: ArgK/MeaB family GTPase [Alphaproteobacteria bacterium]
MSPALPGFEALATGKKVTVARALAGLETHTDDPALIDLLDAAWAAPKGHVVGITGPPGVGKSSLIHALIGLWRARGQTVAVIAVDPSSRRTGGALLGDRTRITADPDDTGIFIRSMAARDRLGGLADLTFPATILLRAVYDRIIVETVGVGQSETEIADIADTVVFCVQPASGDALQFMKAGIVEVPNIAVVTKADMGRVAERAKADFEGALGLAVQNKASWPVEVVLVSVRQSAGLGALGDAVERHRSWLLADGAGRLSAQRGDQARTFLTQTIQDRFGREGVGWARREGRLASTAQRSPFRIARDIAADLAARFQ